MTKFLEVSYDLVLNEYCAIDRQRLLTDSLTQRLTYQLMQLALMQPYLFPYIGYFQLMQACDTFVVFDDARYIKNGWINRNRLLIRGDAQWATLPVVKANHLLPINQRHYLLSDPLAMKLRRKIIGAYAKAPFFEKTMPVIDIFLSFHDMNVANFNVHQLRTIAEHLGIQTPIILSSSIEKNDTAVGQERVIDICQRLHAQTYINPISGVKLYRKADFSETGISLHFLQSMALSYKQYDQTPIPALSIIDVMMFNDVADIQKMLGQYQLV